MAGPVVGHLPTTDGCLWRWPNGRSNSLGLWRPGLISALPGAVAWVINESVPSEGCWAALPACANSALTRHFLILCLPPLPGYLTFLLHFIGLEITISCLKPGFSPSRSGRNSLVLINWQAEVNKAAPTAWHLSIVVTRVGTSGGPA